MHNELHGQVFIKAQRTNEKISLGLKTGSIITAICWSHGACFRTSCLGAAAAPTRSTDGWRDREEGKGEKNLMR